MAGDRSPEQIQQEIEEARAALASSLDQLAELASPKRLAERGKSRAVEYARTPQGMAVLGGVGLLLTLIVLRRSRRR